MIFTEAELDNLSTLARIKVSDEEKPKMIADIQAILGYISAINEVTGELTRGEERMVNVVRVDVARDDSISNREELLDEAPKRHGDYVEVMQVLK